MLSRLEGRRPADLGVELLAACDVQTVFTDAAAVFGPQKGAGPIPWAHEPNRGFLVCLSLLAKSARAIGEDEEWERCSQFLRDSSPTAYDELLGRIAERQGDTVAAREWWQAARRQGQSVGSPHQVTLADTHLERVPESAARRPPRRRRRDAECGEQLGIEASAQTAAWQRSNVT